MNDNTFFDKMLNVVVYVYYVPNRSPPHNGDQWHCAIFMLVRLLLTIGTHMRFARETTVRCQPTAPAVGALFVWCAVAAEDARNQGLGTLFESTRASDVFLEDVATCPHHTLLSELHHGEHSGAIVANWL